MRTLIENIVNSELTLLIEWKRSAKSGRRRHVSRDKRNTRLTQRQKRERAYNRAFGNGDIDEKAVDSFMRYMVVTREGCLKKPYSWSLTRTVWAAKRICEFAKTFKTRPKNIEQADTVCREYFNDYFFPLVFQLAKKNDNNVQADIYKRLTYMLNFLEKAVKYGNKNRWGVVASNILVSYNNVRQYWFGENATE